MLILIFNWLKPLLLKFTSPIKKIPPVKFPIPPPLNTPYPYLENHVARDSNKLLLKKSVTETQCNRIVNRLTAKIYEM